ncbi:response regulator transcription factor [Domibacillus robiginosus]|uniref:response regulator transcription factor n=1 Tax=Domibacillus robiginosus TaxID=1071054 RepID=UPI00067E5C70|nr:response regulator transcription factor [Domibacillus robiginosus]
MHSILILESKEDQLDVLHSLLDKEEIRCLRAISEDGVIHMVQNELIDLFVLDLTSSPGLWLETCKKVKGISNIPILILTESTDKESILNGLYAGVDDFMTKPIDEDIFLAKIKANLRREGLISVSEIHFNGLVLNREMYEAKYENVILSLTQKEFNLLDCFLSNKNQVLTREHLITQIWGYKYTDTRTVDSHIRNLRGKLRDVEFPVDDHLRTSWGYGYMWVSGVRKEETARNKS